MSDRIFIAGLSLHAYHGVMPYEGKVGQTFTIDLELAIDLAAAARSDKVADTVSYDKVVDCAAQAFTGQRFRLIEAAAGARGRRDPGGVPARRLGQGDHPQAACADRRHLRGRRRHSAAGARRPEMTQALLALGGNVGNSRAILDRAVGLLCDGRRGAADSRAPPTI